MVEKGIARHGDTVTWGGTIVATATHTFADGKAVARVGDKTTVHGHPTAHHVYYLVGTILTGSSMDFAEGKAIARIGDYLSCGCYITRGSSDIKTE